jgi:hypothetical protein
MLAALLILMRGKTMLSMTKENENWRVIGELVAVQKETNRLLRELVGAFDTEKLPTRKRRKSAPTARISETLLLSEKALARDWNTSEEERAWESL